MSDNKESVKPESEETGTREQVLENLEPQQDVKGGPSTGGGIWLKTN